MRRQTCMICIGIMVGTTSLEFLLFLASIPFFIIGFIGNVLVIRIVHKTRTMHSTTNYLLANLAFSDAITIFLAPLYYFSYVFGYQSDGFGKFACKFLSLIDISIVVSSLNLTVLAVERYHAFLRPFRTGLRLGEENVKRAIVFIWIASVLLSLPEVFLQEWSEKFHTCIGPWTLHMNQASRIYIIIGFVFSAVPLVVLFYCYGALVKGLYFTNTICAAGADEDRSRNREKKKLVITFILATAGFIIGYQPLIVLNAVAALRGDEKIGFRLYSRLSCVFLFVFDCSLCLNPILYAFRSTNFQNGLKDIIFCRKPTLQNENEIQL